MLDQHVVVSDHDVVHLEDFEIGEGIQGTFAVFFDDEGIVVASALENFLANLGSVEERCFEWHFLVVFFRVEHFVEIFGFGGDDDVPFGIDQGFFEDVFTDVSTFEEVVGEVVEGEVEAGDTAEVPVQV